MWCGNLWKNNNKRWDIKVRQLSSLSVILLELEVFWRFQRVWKWNTVKSVSLKLQKQSAANLQENTHAEVRFQLLRNFIEITLQHGCSPVNSLHIFRKLFLRTLFLRTPLEGCFWSSYFFSCQSPHTFWEIPNSESSEV